MTKKSLFSNLSIKALVLFTLVISFTNPVRAYAISAEVSPINLISQEIVSAGNGSDIGDFLRHVYNEHRYLYALIVTLSMATAGLAIALLTDKLLRFTGADKFGRTPEKPGSKRS